MDTMIAGPPGPGAVGAAPVAVAVRMTGLTKRYGARAAVDHLTTDVPTGVVCGFVGPNGAGKTTTIRMLLGLVRPSEGTAEVLGHPVSDPSAYLDRVGALIESPAFYPTLSGRKNLRVLARLAGLPDERVDAVLAQVGLADRAGDLFRSYSLGMKQRLGIASALLGDPDLLVLDEPTNGLDPPGIREVRALLSDLAAAGKTVLVSSHLLDELQHVADHLVMIDSGRLVFAGPVDELLSAQASELRAVPEQAGDLPALVELCRQAGFRAEARDGELRVAAPTQWAGELNRRSMAAGITLTALGSVPTRLEDVFFTLTARVPGAPEYERV
jgi:ABC-2 type transport system ATP-binding protein